MGRKSKVSSEIKVKVVEEYLAGLKTMSQITYELDINYSTIQEWVRKYKQFGIKELLTERINTKYSDEIKTKAINDFRNVNGSLRDICIRYKISSHSILRKWKKGVCRDKLDKINATQSMSRIGHCINNGPMEGFWGISCSWVFICYLQNKHKLKGI